MLINLKKSLFVLCITLLTIIISGCEKTYKSDNTELLTCISYSVDETYGIYDTHVIDLIESKDNKLTSITHIATIEAPEEEIESLYLLLKGELNNLKKVKGMDISVLRVEDNNVTYIIKENLLELDYKKQEETLKNNKLFTYDETNKNTTVNEYLSKYEELYTMCK